MFSGGLRESLDNDVNFRDSIHPEVPVPPPPVSQRFSVTVALISPLLQILELLLDFAYSSRVAINEENAESLLEAGDMLQFHDVRDAAAEFLESHLNSSNCLGMMLLSDAHQCKRLYELSWRMCLLHYETVKLYSRPLAALTESSPQVAPSKLFALTDLPCLVVGAATSVTMLMAFAASDCAVHTAVVRPAGFLIGGLAWCCRNLVGMCCAKQVKALILLVC